MKKLEIAAAVIACAGIAGAAWIWQGHGAYGFGVIAHTGGNYWTEVAKDDPSLDASIRAAIRPDADKAVAGAFAWKAVAPGYEVTEIPVMLDGAEVDRLILSRIDPAYYRFTAHNAPEGRNIGEWKKALPRAALIVNGSYFDKKGLPDTPFVSDGQALGPQTYDARAGAFVANDAGAAVIDLQHQAWRDALKGSADAMVSYPMLVGEDGQTRVTVASNWLANRTFVAEDGTGHIIVGSTRAGFFSLGRLAAFLKAAPLGIRTALNLDGGPIACRGERVGGFRRDVHATVEAQPHDTTVGVLRWPLDEDWGMPIVLAVEPKS
ncbi:phosphodiester glycosidase family protein [Asticcacaulis solisilvae]|uniref:phosphodiester glycosidase family protein n=1 Tax=Asticcacaulis solisilvae TaxID=1217274 RepID=UPI003FD6EAE5